MRMLSMGKSVAQNFRVDRGRRRILATISDELCHPLFKNGQRYGAERQKGIVEFALIELRPERLLSLAAMPTNLQFAELVRGRLTRPGDITIHLGRDLVLRQRDIVLHVLKRLISRPTIVLNASVDDQTRGAP